MPTVSIVGVGRVGTALAEALTRADGYFVDRVITRRSELPIEVLQRFSPAVQVSQLSEGETITSDVVILSPADKDLREVATSIAKLLPDRAIILHTSGSISSDILADLRTPTRHVGGLHPLISFAGNNVQKDIFSGAYFGVEGDKVAVNTAKRLALVLGGFPIEIAAGTKSLYHAAAVTACGHLIAVIDAAVEMMMACGPSRDESRAMLLPLIESTVANLKTGTVESALTGSFARGDTDAVERHIEALAEHASNSANKIYKILGERSLDIALRRGLDPREAKAVREKLQ